jgi:TctA family transporter
MLENSLRKTLMMFRGDFTHIFERPIALVFLIIAAGIILLKLFLPALRFLSRERS